MDLEFEFFLVGGFFCGFWGRFCWDFYLGFLGILGGDFFVGLGGVN